MNDWNQLENRLRSWKPRRPSPSLKARLFPDAAAAEHDFAWATALNWFAPALAVLCLSTFILSRQPGNFAVPSALSMVSADYAAAAPGDHNIWPRASFEWTNTSGSTSTTGALDFLNTNNSRTGRFN